MASDDIKKIINEADEDLLRMSVEQWAVQSFLKCFGDAVFALAVAC